MGKTVSGLAESAAKQGAQLRDKIATEREIADLAKQENDLLLEIGKAAYEADNSVWPQDERIKQIRIRIKELQDALDEAGKASAAAATAAVPVAVVAAGQICPGCGQSNAEGVKFCSSCGSKLDAKIPCPTCGAELPPGTKFCGECGSKVE